MSGPAGARRRAERFGRAAETLCAGYLWLHGFRILARRLRTPAGEIDIIARRGRLIIFIEVKARPDLETGLAAIGTRQRRRLARAAEAFLATYGQAEGFDVRFDVMLVRPWRLPTHIADAWRPDSIG